MYAKANLYVCFGQLAYFDETAPAHYRHAATSLRCLLPTFHYLRRYSMATHAIYLFKDSNQTALRPFIGWTDRAKQADCAYYLFQWIYFAMPTDVQYARVSEDE